MTPIGSTATPPARAGNTLPDPPAKPSDFDHAVDAALKFLDYSSLVITCVPVGGPVLQAAPDLAAAAIRLGLKHDAFGAGYSVACAAPFLGDALGVARVAGKVPRMAEAAGKAAGWGARMSEKAFDAGAKVSAKVMPWIGKAFGGAKAAKAEKAAAAAETVAEKAVAEEEKVVSIFKNRPAPEASVHASSTAEHAAGHAAQEAPAAEALPPRVRSSMMSRMGKRAIGHLMGQAYVMGMPASRDARIGMLPADQQYQQRSTDYALQVLGASRGAAGPASLEQLAQQYQQAAQGRAQAMNALLGHARYVETRSTPPSGDPSSASPEEARQQIEQRMTDPGYLGAPAAASPAVEHQPSLVEQYLQHKAGQAPRQ
jgi:hypothetical protein